MTPEQIKTMSAAEVAKAPAEHNKWRRREGKYENLYTCRPFSVQTVGAIIDHIVELLKEPHKET